MYDARVSLLCAFAYLSAPPAEELGRMRRDYVPPNVVWQSHVRLCDMTKKLNSRCVCMCKCTRACAVCCLCVPVIPIIIIIIIIIIITTTTIIT
jgi:hypothetical protein